MGRTEGYQPKTGTKTKAPGVGTSVQKPISRSMYLLQKEKNMSYELTEENERLRAEVKKWQAIAEGYQYIFEDSYRRHQTEIETLNRDIESLVDEGEYWQGKYLVAKREVARDILDYFYEEARHFCDTLCGYEVLMVELAQLKEKYGIAEDDQN